MTLVEYPYAALILPDGRDLDPAPYLDTAASVLARLDPVSGGRPHISAHGNKVLAQRFGVVVLPEEDSDYGPKVVVEVTTVDGDRPADDEAAAKILSDVVLAALKHSSADILEWYAPDVLLDRDDFIRLRSYVSPKRLVDVDTHVEDALFENELIDTCMRETLYGAPTPVPEDERPEVKDRLAAYKVTIAAQPPNQRRLSVAGHLMAGMLSILSLPVAAFVYVVVLLRGMDFRLISQAMAVTALFTALYNAERLGGVLETFVR